VEAHVPLQNDGMLLLTIVYWHSALIKIWNIKIYQS
jgi:hypothetical protein